MRMLSGWLGWPVFRPSQCRRLGRVSGSPTPHTVSTAAGPHLAAEDTVAVAAHRLSRPVEGPLKMSERPPADHTRLRRHDSHRPPSFDCCPEVRPARAKGPRKL